MVLKEDHDDVWHQGAGLRVPLSAPQRSASAPVCVPCRCCSTDTFIRATVDNMHRPLTKVSLRIAITLTLLIAPLCAQTKRLWVLRSTGDMIEFDPVKFVQKQTVKLPPEAAKSPASVEVNQPGQILFAPPISLPISDEDATSAHTIWIWNGQSASSIDLGVQRKSEKTGSNQAITDIVPVPHLSADGASLYWFANESRKLERQDIDLSTTITWKAWRTDLNGAGRQEIASTKLPDCRCPTGSCEESCPSMAAWVPESGVNAFFLVTQLVTGQTSTLYKSTMAYIADSGKWVPTVLPEPLQRILDSNQKGDVILSAIPDTGCCGWSNQSDDQTLLWTNGKKVLVFDERETYKNPDYDVSFFSANGKLSPDSFRVAMTIVATTESGKPIQLSDQGEANPEESQSIRKSLTAMPAVVVKTEEDPPKQVAFVPRASLVGWLTEKELLIVEDHFLVVYNVTSAVRHKTTIRVDDSQHVFLR